MTNLTDKWKKSELLEGFYYVRCAWSDEVEIRYVHNGVDEWQEIIAEVPSFEEYQKLLSDQLAKNEGVEINNELEERLKKTQKLELDLRRENRNLKKWCEEFNALDVAKENAQLKELLKECRDEIEYLRKHYKGSIDHLKNNTRLDKEINQVLGENK